MSPKCKNLKSSSKLSNSNNNNQNGNLNKNSTIQIIQDGDDIRINIDGNIEIVTNRLNDRKVISLSPQCARKMSNIKALTKSDAETAISDTILPKSDEKSEDSPKKVEEEDFEEESSISDVKIQKEATEQPQKPPSSEEKKVDKEEPRYSEIDLSVVKKELLNSDSVVKNASNNKIAIEIFDHEEDGERTVNADPVKRLDLASVVDSAFSKLKPEDKSRKAMSMHNLDTPNLGSLSAQPSLECLDANGVSKKSKKKKGIKLKFLLDDSSLLDTLYQQATDVSQKK